MKKIGFLFLCYCLLHLWVPVSYIAYGSSLMPGVGIYETAHIHTNGSGNFEVAADLSKIEPLIKVASVLADVTPEATTKSIQEAFSTAARSLGSIPGVSKVATTYDTKTLGFKLKFEFNGIRSLNKAICILYAHIDHPGSTYFKMGRRTFERIDTVNVAQLLTHYRKEAEKQRKNPNTQIEDLILKNILNAITYHITYSFDKKIKEISNTLADITEDHTTVVLTQSLADAHAKERSFSNKVIFSG